MDYTGEGEDLTGMVCTLTMASWTCMGNIAEHVFPFPVHSSALNNKHVPVIFSAENTLSISVSSPNGL